MNILVLGVTLMVIGVVILIASLVRNKKVNVAANNNSVAVGGNNSGVVLNINRSEGIPAKKEHEHSHGITILGIAVELVGIGVTIWHAMHLAGK